MKPFAKILISYWCSAAILWFTFCVGFCLVAFVDLGIAHPSVGIPLLIFLWASGAWLFHYKMEKISQAD